MKAITIMFGALLAASPCICQQMPVFGSTPNPGTDRVEVRFARGKRAITCRAFTLLVKRGSQMFINGRFSSGFKLPAGASPTGEELDIQIACGKYRWHFGRVPGSALLQGWWWVGTDYPPFQTEFGGARFSKCKSIHYLIVHPVSREGFDYFETIPKTLEGSKEACTGG